MHPCRLPPLFLAVLLAAGCGPGLKDRLVGKWSQTQRARDGKAEAWIEFHADGSVTSGENVFGLSKESSGAYRILDADTVELDYDGRKVWYRAAVSGGTLT